MYLIVRVFDGNTFVVGRSVLTPQPKINRLQFAETLRELFYTPKPYDKTKSKRAEAFVAIEPDGKTAVSDTEKLTVS